MQFSPSPSPVASAGPNRGSALQILLIFLRLGCTCFGGPVAHLGYFRAEFVERRKWLDETSYADLVALSQFLPGPASSQTGFAIGLTRGGILGGLAAWTGFTLPSAVLLILFAFGAGGIAGSALGAGVLHGLKLVAVAIVAQAVLGMARSLCPDRNRASIAVAAIVVLLIAPGSLGQLGAIILGGAAGLALCRGAAVSAPSALETPISRPAAIGFLAGFLVLLALSLAPGQGGVLGLASAFYRSGALVFGGGHVVLPLLRDAVVAPGSVSDSAFLTGYGAAQAVPGPLFTFAAYLGAVAAGVGGAVVALIAIFVPGLLALGGTLPFWHGLRTRPAAQAAMRGINAAVVGILAAALYDPVWTSAVLTPIDFAVAATGFMLLVAWRASPLGVVLLSAMAGAALAMTHA